MDEKLDLPPPYEELYQTSTLKSKEYKDQHQKPTGTNSLQNVHPLFGPGPSCAECPKCKQIVVTKVRTEPSGRHPMSGLIIYCLMCLHYHPNSNFMDEYKTKIHQCPMCNTFMGYYNKTTPNKR